MQRYFCFTNMQKNLNLLFLDIFELHPRIVLNINACFTHSSSNKPPLGTCILPGYSSIKGHWNQEPQKPRRDDNVALKALRATATTRPVTGLPPSAGKSSICRTRLFLLLLLLPAPWPKAGRLGVVTLTTFRPSFRAPFFRLHSDQQQLRESVVWPTFGGVPPPTIVLSRLSMPPGLSSNKKPEEWNQETYVKLDLHTRKHPVFGFNNYRDWWFNLNWIKWIA